MFSRGLTRRALTKCHTRSLQVVQRQYVRPSLDDILKGSLPVDIHPEVEEALRRNRPIVALESTIITHGMPQPVNLQTAQSVENLVRKSGSIPATIGIISGRVKIGLHKTELERLSDLNRETKAVKVSRRDIGACIALGKDGGTTCSATLIFASLVGIKVFSTGGLGGVHRNGENSMDISADLTELTRCPVALVSAGIKSILDIRRTLEYLETLGVPVLTYGETDDFPAFYSAKSGYKSPWRVDNASQAATVMGAQWELGLSNGLLFGVPIPEQYRPEGENIQKAVEQAIQEANANGMSTRGKEVTPWLLSRVGELTQGKSLRSNVALIENTAEVGGRIAAEYSRLEASPSSEDPVISHPTTHLQVFHNSQPIVKCDGKAQVVVVGASAVDITSKVQALEGNHVNFLSQSTSRGAVALSVGGVARNIAEATHRVLSSSYAELSSSNATLLVSPIGDDAFANILVNDCEGIELRTDGLLRREGSRTAVCNMVVDEHGALIGGVADMDITRETPTDEFIKAVQQAQPHLVALDGNLFPETISTILSYCVQNNIPTLFEPTSVVKSTTVLDALEKVLETKVAKSPIDFITPNAFELSEIYRQADSEKYSLLSSAAWWSTIDSFGLGEEWRIGLKQLCAQPLQAPSTPLSGSLSFLQEQGLAQMAVQLLPFFQHIILKCGKLGVVVVMRISGIGAKNSPWVKEHTNMVERQVVAKNRDMSEIIVLKHFPAINISEQNIVNVTGAGDSLVGALCAGLVIKPDAMGDPHELSKLIALGQKAAALSLKSASSVSSKLSEIQR